MTRKTLDPNLASILDSIRATVGGEPAAPAPEPAESAQASPSEAEETVEEQPAPRASRATRKAAAAQPVPAPAGSRTVEEFLAELIRPQVDAWLKANLPELIQKMAAEEIGRLTGRK